MSRIIHVTHMARIKAAGVLRHFTSYSICSMAKSWLLDFGLVVFCIPKEYLMFFSMKWRLRVLIEKFGSAVEVVVTFFLQTPVKTILVYSFYDKGSTFAPMTHSDNAVNIHKFLYIWDFSPALHLNSANPWRKLITFQNLLPPQIIRYSRPLCRDTKTLTTVLRYLSQALSKTAETHFRPVCRTSYSFLFSLWMQFVRAWIAMTSSSSRMR